eukprot:11830132-Heterocapsa_arctica.AAC.1
MARVAAMGSGGTEGPLPEGPFWGLRAGASWRVSPQQFGVGCMETLGAVPNTERAPRRKRR